jgi:hypothetical protein
MTLNPVTSQTSEHGVKTSLSPNIFLASLNQTAFPYVAQRWLVENYQLL